MVDEYQFYGVRFVALTATTIGSKIGSSRVSVGWFMFGRCRWTCARL